MNIRVTHPGPPAGQEPAETGVPLRRAGEHEGSFHAVAGTVREASRYLTAQGFGPTEVGNLTAYAFGLDPAEGGWTVDEIERLLFVRHLVERQLLRS